MLTLLLRVKGSSGQVRDVNVEIEDTHTVADLSRALSAHLAENVPTGHIPQVLSDRLGHLPGDSTVASIGLLSGDEVSLSLTLVELPSVRAEMGGGLVLDVIGGPRTGLSIPLRAGSYRVGRSQDMSVSLDDPTVSSHHATVHVDTVGGATVEPGSSVTNPLTVAGEVVSSRVTLMLGSVVQLGSSAFTVRFQKAEIGTPRDQLGQIPFNRTPYRRPDIGEPTVEGPGRLPTRYERSPFQIIAMIMPAMSGLLMWATMPNGGSRYLLLALLTPVMALATWWDDRRRGGKKHRLEVAEFDVRRLEWMARYDVALDEERAVRNLGSPDLASIIRRARIRNTELWQRNVHVPDFLTVRVGFGDDQATTVSEIPSGDDNSLLNQLEDAKRDRLTLSGVPITVDLIQHAVSAIHGPGSEVDKIATAIAVQIAGLHSPEDVIITAALGSGRPMAGWVKWLPHTRSVSSPISGDHVVEGKNSAEDLLRRILEVGETQGEIARTHVVLFLDERCEADSVLVSALLSAAANIKCSVVWLGDSLNQVPRQASAVIECPEPKSGARGHLWFTDPSLDTRQVDLDGMGTETALEFARSLAPVTDTTSASATASIPRMAPLFSSLGVLEATPEWIAENWKNNNRYGLRAPIGIGAAGQFSIDLVANGPHGLIAGTSGAGKSELLQSLVASLASQYPPERLNFLFIDYKGGASSNMFKDIPHTVGSVTNLSPSLSMRALTSLRAELNRRMRVLEGRAKDLEEMLEKHPADCPPSLVIVVDEFATLVKEIPDFVVGMVDVAQRGRSLGIHLILATQRPTGAVNDNILANTNLRISLRVLDSADSQSIIGTSDAAFLPAPLKGRAFARTGAGQMMEFQSAFAGAPFTSFDGTSTMVVDDFPLSNRTTKWPHRTEISSSEKTVTQLERLILSVVEATQNLGKVRGRSPWLEALPELIPFASLANMSTRGLDAEFALELGLLDDPGNQSQFVYQIDLEASGNLLIAGNVGSGKTTFLRTVVMAALSHAEADNLEMFVLDYGGKGLDSLRRLKQVRALGNTDDPETSTRILQHLLEEVGNRQEAFAALGVESLQAHNRSAEVSIPRVLVLIDGYDTFLRNFEMGSLSIWPDLLRQLVTTGRSVGVHFVMTADRFSSLPISVLNATPERVMLRMTEHDSYTDMGLSFSVARDLEMSPGQFIAQRGLFGLVAFVGESPLPSDQTSAVVELSQRIPTKVQPLLPLPNLRRLADLREDEMQNSLIVGVADMTGSTVRIDLKRDHVLVVGHPESGKTATLKTLASELTRIGKHCLVLTDNEEAWSSGFNGELAVELEQQTDALRRLREAPDDPQAVVLIDFENEFDDDMSRQLDQQIRQRFTPIVASMSYQMAMSFSSGVFNTVKKSRLKILLQPDEESVVSSIGDVRIRWRPQMQFPPGRAVLIEGRKASIIQVASCD